jgi:hypothetical protein
MMHDPMLYEGRLVAVKWTGDGYGIRLLRSSDLDHTPVVTPSSRRALPADTEDTASSPEDAARRIAERRARFGSKV